MTKSASCIDEDEAVVKYMEKACGDLNHPVVISGTPQHDDADYLYNMGTYSYNYFWAWPNENGTCSKRMC